MKIGTHYPLNHEAHPYPVDYKDCKLKKDMKYIITWVVITTVYVSCPKSYDKFGRELAGLTVGGCTNRKSIPHSKTFLNLDSANVFYNEIVREVIKDESINPWSNQIIYFPNNTNDEIDSVKFRVE